MILRYKLKIIETDEYIYSATIERVNKNPEEEIIDIDVVNTEIADLKVKIAEVEKQMAKYLEELGLN